MSGSRLIRKLRRTNWMIPVGVLARNVARAEADPKAQRSSSMSHASFHGQMSAF